MKKEGASVRRPAMTDGEAAGGRTLEDNLYIAGILVLFIGVPALLIYLYFIRPRFSPICVFRAVTGLYCPGCGGTRSVLALIRGRVLDSLIFYPAIPYAIVIFAAFMVTQTVQRLTRGRVRGMRFHYAYLYVAVGLIALNWIVKNALILIFDITV